MLQTIRKNPAPVIYSISLVARNEGGVGPTARELRQATRYLFDYVSRKDSALKVENAIRTAKSGISTMGDIKARLQRFLCKNQAGPQSAQVKGHDNVVRIFADALNRYLDKEKDEDRPINPPLKYIGYAFRYAKRQEEQEQKQASFLTRLVNSICHVLFKDRFNLEGLPICYLAEGNEARYGELLFSLITDSFYSTSRGFNVAVLGQSTASARTQDYRYEEVVEFWKERGRFRMLQPWTERTQEKLREKARTSQTAGPPPQRLSRIEEARKRLEELEKM